MNHRSEMVMQAHPWMEGPESGILSCAWKAESSLTNHANDDYKD